MSNDDGCVTIGADAEPPLLTPLKSKSAAGEALGCFAVRFNAALCQTDADAVPLVFSGGRRGRRKLGAKTALVTSPLQDSGNVREAPRRANNLLTPITRRLRPRKGKN